MCSTLPRILTLFTIPLLSVIALASHDGLVGPAGAFGPGAETHPSSANEPLRIPPELKPSIELLELMETKCNAKVVGDGGAESLMRYNLQAWVDSLQECIRANQKASEDEKKAVERYVASYQDKIDPMKSVDDYIKELGGGTYSSRQKAQGILIAKGNVVLPAMKTAIATSKDKEIRDRATHIRNLLGGYASRRLASCFEHATSNVGNSIWHGLAEHKIRCETQDAQ